MRWSRASSLQANCAAHGATTEEALKNIREAIDFWIETAHEDGGEVPEHHRYELLAA